MMDESDGGNSLNHATETDLNMEIEHVAGAKENVPREGIEKAVPGENNSSTADLNIIPVVSGGNSPSANDLNVDSVVENLADQPINASDDSRSNVNGDLYASRAARTAGSASNEKPTWWRPSNYASNDMPKRP